MSITHFGNNTRIYVNPIVHNNSEKGNKTSLRKLSKSAFIKWSLIDFPISVIYRSDQISDNDRCQKSVDAGYIF